MLSRVFAHFSIVIVHWYVLEVATLAFGENNTIRHTSQNTRSLHYDAPFFYSFAATDTYSNDHARRFFRWYF
jgi:hypothetical protein